MAKLFHMAMPIARLLSMADERLGETVALGGEKLVGARVRSLLEERVKFGQKWVSLDAACDMFSLDQGCLGHDLCGSCASILPAHHAGCFYAIAAELIEEGAR